MKLFTTALMLAASGLLLAAPAQPKTGHPLPVPKFDQPSAGDNPGEEQPPPSGFPIPPAPIRSPEEALKTFRLPPGYRIEVVAAEPLVNTPVSFDFDPDGRLWVVEFRGYQNNPEGSNRLDPVGRIVVVEDSDGDGKMDRSTTYMEGLVLARSVKVLSDGVLVAEPPYVWHTRDTDGDGKADEKTVVVDDYGPRMGNPARTPNGLIWGMDNWLHSLTYSSHLRRVGGKWVRLSVPLQDHFGMGMDDYGRTYANPSAALRVNLVSSHYQVRNPHHDGGGGVYEVMSVPEDKAIWPARPNPGTNRGYFKDGLRKDGTLPSFTATCGISIFRGDRLPAEIKGNHFICEPAGNFIRRSVFTETPDGRIVAKNPHFQSEFLASTDERFRPVYTLTAPDGTLYIADLYRGILESHPFVTTFLKRQIYERGLHQGLDRGRIYRVVHESVRPGPAPRMSRMSPAELVAVLTHPNGWWRDTAQRLLVERGDRSITPDLRRLARNNGWDVTRLHALWTMEGIGTLEVADILAALLDPSRHIRSAAVRLAEPWLKTPGGGRLTAPVLKTIDDPAASVRLQAAVSLGELPGADGEAALANLLQRYSGQPYIVDAVVSGLANRELEFIERLGRNRAWDSADDDRARAISVLAAAVFVEGKSNRIARMLNWAAASERPVWQKLAVLESTKKPPTLPSSIPIPKALVDSPDERVRSASRKLAAKLTVAPSGAGWEPTVEDKALIKGGAKNYVVYCAQCHQPNGRGLTDTAPALAGSKWVLGSDEILARIVLHGKQRQAAIMPPWGNALDDSLIAGILTYIRQEWGNRAPSVAEATIRKVRAETKSVTTLWTDETLAELAARKSR